MSREDGPGGMRAFGWTVLAALLVAAFVPATQAGLALSPSRLAGGEDAVWGWAGSNETDGNTTDPATNSTAPGGNSTTPSDPEGPVDERDFCVVSSDVGMYCTTVLMADPEEVPPLPQPGPPPPAPTPGPSTGEDYEGDEPVGVRAGVVPQGGADAGGSAGNLVRPPSPQAAAPAEHDAGPWPPAPSAGTSADLAPDPGEGSQPSDGAASAQKALAGHAWVALALAVPWAIGVKAASLLALGRGGAPSPVRGEVLALVAAHPGMRHAELVRRVGRGNGTVEHHVRVLIAEGRLARLRRGRSTCYYPATMPEAQAGLRLALQGASARRLAEALLHEPGLRLGAVARRAGVSSPTAHYHLRRLLEAGVLRCEGARFEVAEEARPLLAVPVAPLASRPSGRPKTFALGPRLGIGELAQDTPV